MRYFICLILIYCCCLANAQEAGSPYFEYSGADVEAGLGLTATSASVNIAGVIAEVTVRQTYVNGSGGRLEATYVFPGSTGAAVHGLTMEVGNRRIEGLVQRKAEARAAYEAAKAEGKRASLLEQHRPNVFEMNVANILPGDTIAVELRYTELLVPEHGTYRFVFPTVVGPRYVGENTTPTTYTAQPYATERSEHPPAAATSNINNQTSNVKNLLPSNAFNLDVHLRAGVPVSTVGSPSHRITTATAGDATTIGLDGAESAGGNRDFVLEYQLQGQHIQTGMLLFEGEEENYFLYLAQPPAETTDGDYPPREFVFVVDVSGSMNGFPLDVSKKLLTRLIGQLRPVDAFNVVLFAGASQTWQDASQPATAENLAAALTFLQSARGGGGTRLLSALQTAYALPRSGTGLSRNFVVVTDGYISVEPEVFDLVRQNLNQANVYSFGIGSGVNRHLIEGMARVGKGRPAFVLDPSDADGEADRFRRYISEPVLTEMALDFGEKFDAYDVEPLSLPDLSRERPLVVFGKYRGKPKGELTLTGYGGYPGLDAPGLTFDGQGDTEAESRRRDFPFRLRDAAADPRNAGLRHLWARERIRRLDDYNDLRHDAARVEEVTRLGLDYNLLTQYTSFVAVEETPAADPNDPLATHKQVLPLPENVSATAVGFDLGLSGVVGLPGMVATPWYLYAAVGLLAGLGCFFMYMVFGRRLRAFLPLLLILPLTACDPGGAAELPVRNDTPVDTAPGAATITFILGEDEGTNAYYDRAEQWFRAHPEEGGDFVVREVRSLAGVRAFLADHAPAGRPWAKVNLVVHGNQWTGLALPLSPAAPNPLAPNPLKTSPAPPRQASGTTAAAPARTTADQLSRWNPAPLPAGTIGPATELVVHGCSVGRDTALLLHLSRTFAGEDHAPAVLASVDFTLFRNGPAGPERHYAEYYFRARPLGKYPLPAVMATRFARQHPDKPIDWDEALNTTRFATDLQPYVYQFNVPVTWTRVYPAGSAPAPTDDEKATWLAGEADLLAKLRRMGLRPGNFLWDFSAAPYPLADGSTLPAVTARGVSRLFCVLVPRAGTTEMVRLRWAG